MNVDVLHGFLLAMSELNHGCNHVCTYQAERVAPAGSLQQSLQQHFERPTLALKDRGGWTVSVTEPAEAERLLVERARAYFFEGPFCPRLHPDGNGIERFMQGFRRCCEAAMGQRSFRVFVLEVRSSECVIDLVHHDFVLSAGDDHLLIHFGVSD